MNKQRRKKIQETILKIESLHEEIGSLLEDVESIFEEEQEYLESIPENLMNSGRYQIAESACENLGQAKYLIEDLSSNIDDVVSYLEDAME